LKRIIEFYKTEKGKCLVEDFLDKIPSKTAQKVTWVLNLIEELDIVPDKYFKKLSNTNEIWECRVKLGSDIYRLLGFFHKGSILILTHGFQKKTQKTPIQEIEKAEAIKKDFYRSMK